MEFGRYTVPVKSLDTVFHSNEWEGVLTGAIYIPLRINCNYIGDPAYCICADITFVVYLVPVVPLPIYNDSS